MGEHAVNPVSKTPKKKYASFIIKIIGLRPFKPVNLNLVHFSLIIQKLFTASGT
jgi:hypothetical protein